MNSRSRIRTATSRRPFVLMNAAITADGKIATANRAISSFSSARDREHMLELRATVDAVMSGARTVDSGPVNLGPGPARFRRIRLKNGLAEHNLRVIVSGGGSVDPGSEIFKHRFSPILILTTRRASKAARQRLQTVADAVRVCGRHEIDFHAALRWLRGEWGVKRLLCEGGGEVNDALFRAGLVDELHLTVCPKIFGGQEAPTLADGTGFRRLADSPNLQIQSFRRIGNEVFAIFQRRRTGE